MNKIKKSTLLLLLASSLLLSGCDLISAQEYEESENISTDFSSIDSGSVSEETIAATSETLTNAENGQIHKTTDENSNSSNEYLPEGISMDDLRNMVQINGKTLTMPTTLTDIMKLDDRFSYVMAFSEFLSSPEDSIDQMGVVFYDVYFDHLFVFQPCIQKEDYKKDVANCKIDSIPAGLNFKSFKNTELDLTFLNGKVTENSSPEDIIALFGEPNNHNPSFPHKMMYIFCDKEYQFKLTFDFNIEQQLNGVIIECYQN